MNREELDKELDAWLDRAAAEYGRAEMRPGFETRIIANLDARLEKRRWHLFWIPVAAAIMLVMLFLFYVLRTDFQVGRKMEISSTILPEAKSIGEQHQDSAKNAAKTAAIVGRPGAVIFSSLKPHKAGYRASAKAQRTERGRFLSTGLSDRERYLIAFVHLASSETPADTAENDRFERLWKPAEIPAFKIPEYKMPAFKIEPLPVSTSISEETL